ncbi:hypothetical protein DFH11DRAFT_1726577 [Phellopilus nigrolimitatus]|nr:hypothetical protein DFH11DRAFT_1726577 [Phellopilus nigrolimitatus]
MDPKTKTNSKDTPQKKARVNFSSTHASGAQREPLSDRNQEPPKPILRNRDDHQAPPDGAANKDTTLSQMDDALQHESYFQGPLRTLLLSLEEENAGAVSLHDLSEAYSVFSARVMAQADNLRSGVYPALEVIRLNSKNKVGLSNAIRRDMAHARTAPAEINESQCAMSDGEASDARDRSAVCHASLRLLLHIFAFPAVHAVFKLHDQALLVKELLDAGIEMVLPSYNARKTFSHILAVIHNQRLPANAFRSFAPKAALVLERAISGKMGKNGTNGPHAEGLRTVRSQLQRHGDVFFPVFANVFSRVLANLVCTTSSYRSLAAQALAAFSHASLHNAIPLQYRITYAAKVCDFLDNEKLRGKKRDASQFYLSKIFRVKRDDPDYVQNATFALNVIASLIVLSGPVLFTRGEPLRTLIQGIEKATKEKYTEINVLHAATWRCLVWSYAQIPVWGIAALDEDRAERAFVTVRQELKGDVGVALAGCLLERASAERPLHLTHKAAGLVLALAQDSIRYKVAVVLLRRLLAGVLNDSDATTYSWSGACVVPTWLSDGSLMGLSGKKIKKAVLDVPMLDITTVPIFEEAELRETWETLLYAFQAAVISQLRAQISLEVPTINLWRALLRVQVNLIEDYSPSVATPQTILCLSRALASILASLRGFDDRVREGPALRAVLQLWAATREELSGTWTAALVAPLFRRLVELWHGELVRGTPESAWDELARALSFAEPRAAFEGLKNASLGIYVWHVHHRVWVDRVRYLAWLGEEEMASAKDAFFPFLLFPFSSERAYVETKVDDVYLWGRLLERTLSSHPEGPAAVLTAIGEGVQHVVARGKRKGICSLLHFTLSVAYQYGELFTNDALLCAMSVFLSASHPPEDPEEFECIILMKQVKRILHARPPLGILKIIEKGLVPWLEDKDCAVDDDVYNEKILPLYYDAIVATRTLEPLEDAIIVLSELLKAPFARDRIPEPAAGPLAFRTFWDSVAPRLDFTMRYFPPGLADCVHALASAYGGEVPDWMRSQSQTHSSISQDEEVIPASVEELASSDLSLAMVKFDGRTEDIPDTPKAPTRLRGETNEVDVPAPLSPSLGEPLIQFATDRRTVGSIAEPAIALDLDRARKRRRVQSGSSSSDGNPGHNAQAPCSKLEGSVSTETVRPQDQSTEFDGAVLTPMRSPDKLKYTRPSSPDSELLDSSPHIVRQAHASSDDYGNWERGISSQDVRELRGEHNDGAVNDDCEPPFPRNSSPCLWDIDPPDGGNPGNTTMPAASTGLPQANVGQRVERSQTAPAAMASSSLGNERSGPEDPSNGQKPVALRRTHTTTAVPLDALEHLRATMLDDAERMQTQDLAQAAQVILEINGIVTKEMTRKLEVKRR